MVEGVERGICAALVNARETGQRARRRAQILVGWEVESARFALAGLG